jgi:threonine dehydrogenase-like Zn-dependent dehydrogenase
MAADGVADAAHGWLEVHEIQRPVAADIPVEAAVMLCTWREVHGGFGDFHLRPGDRILVYGAGPVGLSFVKFGRYFGLDWIGVVDPLPNKRDTAQTLGASAVFAPDAPEIARLPQTLGRPLDAVIDAVGNPRIINAALPLIKLGGSIGVYGVLADSTISVDKGRGPYNFNLFMHQWPTRARERAAQEPLCDWIRQGKLAPDEFITHRFPVEKVNDALAAVKTGQVIKVVLQY